MAKRKIKPLTPEMAIHKLAGLFSVAVEDHDTLEGVVSACQRMQDMVDDTDEDLQEMEKRLAVSQANLRVAVHDRDTLHNAFEKVKAGSKDYDRLKIDFAKMQTEIKRLRSQVQVSGAVIELVEALGVEITPESTFAEIVAACKTRFDSKTVQRLELRIKVLERQLERANIGYQQLREDFRLLASGERDAVVSKVN